MSHDSLLATHWLDNKTTACTSPKRCVQVVQHLRPGGIEALALDIAGGTDSLSQQLIMSLEGDAASSMKVWPRLSTLAGQLHFFAKRPGIQLGLLLKLVAFFRRHRVEVVHTHHIGPLLYAGIAARLAGVRHLIHTEHDAWHLENRQRRRLQKLLLRILRPTLVADAEKVAENMARHLGQQSIHVIRNGIDTLRFQPGSQAKARQMLGLPAKVTLIGCSGRLEIVKGQKYLLEALALIDSPIHVALAGTGSEEQALKRLADQLGITARVHFLGHVDDMPCFYQALDLFCLPSLNEGFPLSSLEAQACSIPTVVTDVGGSQETLCPETGRLVEPANPEAMATLLIALCNTPPAADPRRFVVETADLNITRQAYRSLSS